MYTFICGVVSLIRAATWAVPMRFALAGTFGKSWGKPTDLQARPYVGFSVVGSGSCSGSLVPGLMKGPHWIWKTMPTKIKQGTPAPLLARPCADQLETRNKLNWI